jgi:hypothetical protein
MWEEFTRTPGPRRSLEIAARVASSERDARGIEDFAEDGFGLLGFFLR